MPWLPHGGLSEPSILRSHQGRVVKANPSFSPHLSQVKHWKFWYQTRDDFLPCTGSSSTLTFLLNGLGCCLQSCAPKRVHFRRARLVFVITSCYIRMPTKFKDWQSCTHRAPFQHCIRSLWALLLPYEVKSLEPLTPPELEDLELRYWILDDNLAPPAQTASMVGVASSNAL